MNEIPFKFTTSRFDPALAEVTIQYTGLDAVDNTQLDAYLVGPICMGRSTVTIAHPLKAVSGEDSKWRVLIPDPCFWSAEEPHLYQLQVKTSVLPKVSWGLHSLYIRKRQFLQQQQPLRLKGVRLTHTLTESSAILFKEHGINLLSVSLEKDPTPTAQIADQYGFHVLYETNPDEEAQLWLAEHSLPLHISTLGYLLPQASMAHPQLWHNTMLHLHRQRRDIFIGITIDTVPLSMVQGHVEFLVTPERHLEDLAGVKMPLLISVRRYDMLNEVLPDQWAGRLSRALPEIS